MKYLCALLSCLPVYAGYAAKATVTFAAASGSTTDTNITLYFTGSDAKLKTAANGGLIQNTVTRNSITVPADFILTNDTTCATQTGSYQWGFKTYSATTGILVGRALIPSLTTGASVVPTVCIGNGAVSTYQGGAAGSEYDTNVKLALDFPDGTTLSVVDSSSGGLNGTLSNTPTASAGHIPGGAAQFASASSQSIFINGNPAALRITGSMTYECWFNAATLPTVGNPVVLMTKDDAAGTRGPILFINNDGTNIRVWGDAFTSSAPTTDQLVQSAVAISSSTWYYAAITYDQSGTGDFTVYVNGGSPNSINFSGDTTTNPTANVDMGARTSTATQINFFNGQEQSDRISSAARTADWLLTTYTNGNSPPAIGAFTAFKSPGQFPRVI